MTDTMDEQERQILKSQLEFTKDLQLQAVSQGDIGGALLHQESIISVITQLYGEGSRELLGQQQTKARYESWLGLHDDAIETLKQILESETNASKEVQPKSKPKDDDDDDEDDNEPFSFKSVRNDLADALSKGERYDEAEEIYRQLLDDVDATNEGHRLGAVLVKRSLALLFAECGRDKEALHTAHEAIDLALKEFGEGDVFLRDARSTLANVYFIQGDFENCRTIRQQVYDEMVKTNGDDHIWTTEAKIDLARIWAVTGREAEANGTLQTAAMTSSLLSGDDSPKNLMTRWYKALVTPHSTSTGYGDVDEMQSIMQKMKIQITKPEMGLGGPEGRVMLRDAFRIYRKFGNLADLLYALRESYLETVDRLGEEHFISARLLQLFTECCLCAGAFDEVIEQLEKVKTVYERVSGPDAPRTLRCKKYLASLQDNEGQLDIEKAIKLLRSELEQNEKDQGVSSHAAFAARVALTMALDSFGRNEDAQTQLRAVAISPLNNLVMANRALETAKLFEQLGLEAEARAIYVKVLPVFELEQGPVSAQVQTATLALARCCEDAGERDMAIEIYKKMIDRGAIFAGPDSLMVEQASAAWTMVNIYQGVSDEESWKIPKDYIKQHSDQWREARRTNLGSSGSIVSEFEKLKISTTE